MKPYTARVLEKVPTKPGCWEYEKIGIFREGVQIGEYVRNYSSFMDTFHHFRLNGKDLALYSPDYTSTRLMELPSCKDIGGEPRDGNGFCPTGYYVPSYLEHEFDIKGEKHRYRIYEPEPADFKDEDKDRVVSDLLFCDFGFISGCVWGDDSSWKIQYLDLSQADKGILNRDERFGYIQLPAKVELKDAIDMDGYEQGFTGIRISTMAHYDLKTGKRAE